MCEFNKEQELEKLKCDKEKLDLDIKKLEIEVNNSKIRLALPDDIEVGERVFILSKNGKLLKVKVKKILVPAWGTFEGSDGLDHSLEYCFVKKT